VIFIFQSRFDLKNFIAITIAIETRSQTNHDPISDSGYFDIHLQELLCSILHFQSHLAQKINHSLA
jgi:hypothetical protein